MKNQIYRSAKRKLLLLSILFLAPLVALHSAEKDAGKPSVGMRDKLNVCFLLADDLRPDTLGILGHPIVKTPNIDKLCADGFAFRNAYTLGSNVQAVCMPSRTMISTGRSYLRPDVQKDLKDGKNYERKEGETPLLGQTVHAAGYASMRSGKFGANPVKLDRYYDEHVDGGTAEGNANNLIAFIKSHAGKQPLFLYFAPHEPHDPQYAPDDYYPRYKAADIPMPVNFLPFHPFDNGEMTVRDEKTLPWPRTQQNVGDKLARYYASTSYFDAQVGRIVEALKTAGEFERTIFIVAADNGLALGEHGLLGKQNLYEFGGMHVPLIFAGPGVAKGETKAFAYLFDIYPTLCELAGIPVPAGLDGKSLVPVIKGQQPKVRDAMFNAYRSCQRSIRDERWKLIRYPLIDKTQLFDLQADPHEMADLSAKPEFVEKIKQLTELLEKTRKDLGDTAPLKVANPKPVDWAPPALGAESKPAKSRKKASNKESDASMAE